MRVFVSGSFRSATREPELCPRFVEALGREIVKQGHVLLNGCRSELDATIARAANKWLTENGRNPRKQIISYFPRGQEPAHNFGWIGASALPDWDMKHAELRFPEQIEKAQVAIFIGGSEGTFGARNWVYWARKPVMGVPRFGGSGETIYQQELSRRLQKSQLAAADYERLNAVRSKMPWYARDIVDLGELLVTPRSVFAVSSFKPEYDPVFTSFKKVGKTFGFKVIRTDKEHSSERILPRIENEIRHSAFVIADLSDVSRNVYYEVGFAMGLQKEIVFTAKKGTPLPFDVVDVPVLWWTTQADLQSKLSARVKAIKKARE